MFNTNLFTKLSNISRGRKFDLFMNTIVPAENMSVLDVGAEVDSSDIKTFQFIDQYPWKKNITAINISQEHTKCIKQLYPEIEVVVGDACQLPWPDNYFDIVYSNAVIEHLTSFEKQKKMAQEIMRVGKKWFVTTPNRWYPFEFHMRLPFVTWLPFNAYLQIGRIISYNHVKKKYSFFNKSPHLRLMTARELKHCFPDSEIIKLRVTFMAETTIVVGKKS